MSYALNNLVTGDVLRTVLDCVHARSVTFTVANAAVIVQLGRGNQGPPATDFDDERLLVPGVHTIAPPRGVDVVRARSAARGVPASLSVATS